MSTPKLIANPPEGIPYILYHRTGNNPHPVFFVFYHPSSNIRVVVDRIKKHCELMNYRFVNVRPLVVDIDEEEKQRFGHSAAQELATAVTE